MSCNTCRTSPSAVLHMCKRFSSPPATRHVHMYIHTYVLHICTYIHTYICMYVCMHYVYVCTYVHTYVRTLCPLRSLRLHLLPKSHSASGVVCLRSDTHYLSLVSLTLTAQPAPTYVCTYIHTSVDVQMYICNAQAAVQNNPLLPDPLHDGRIDIVLVIGLK